MTELLKKIKKKIFCFLTENKKSYFKIMLAVIISIMIFIASAISILISYENLELTFFDTSNEKTKVSWEDSGKLTLQFNNKSTIKINNLKFIDDYLNLKYKIIFPKGYSEEFESTFYTVRNDKINTVEITINENGETEFTINEADIFGYELTQEDNTIYIEPKNPKDIYDKIVVIDPGHGGFDPGTNTAELNEKDITLDIGRKVVTLLDQNPNIKVYTTRTTDTYVDLQDRAQFANKLADLFVSIHVNANDQILSANGTEVYYYPNANESIYNITSKECAEIMCDSLSATLNSRRRENKKDSYIVIRETKMPSILCEVGFLTNKEEAKLLADDSYRTKAAEGISKGVTTILNKMSSEQTTATQNIQD